MSPTRMELTHVMYEPGRDTLEQQKTGAVKHRKSLSTGGGRAWSDSEVSTIHCVVCLIRINKRCRKHI